jgi:multiple sugar transport system permease protein
MPIISQVGRSAFPVKMLYALIYLILIVGGLTMLYPFLLMLSTSVTNVVDQKEYRLVPRYFYDTEVQYLKFLSEKYQMASNFAETHLGSYQSFQQMSMPTYAGDPTPPTSERVDLVTRRTLPPRLALDADWNRIERRVAAWRKFKATLAPIEFRTWYTGSGSMPGKCEVLWRDALRKRCDDDIRSYNRELGKNLGGFTEIFAPFENPDGRLWPGVEGKLGQYWDEFKAGLDPRYRRPVDGTVLWQRYLKYKYEKVENINRQFGTSYGDVKRLLLPPTPPDNAALAKEWEYVVRNELPYRFVEIADGDALYRKYLLDAGGDLAGMNRRLGTTYATADAIKWPPQTTSVAELDNISTFLRTVPEASRLTVATPDKKYVRFLRAEYGDDVTRLNADLGTSYASFDDVRPPYEEEDMWEFRQDRGEWMKWFLTRNYIEVIDYIAIRGRALWNTVILVGAMVLCAVTINPLAAYSLSRFRLGYTNNVLIFLLATMAFPAEVAMIPNFLLLRRFPIWTWLVGLACGLVAAGLILYFAKGRKRILAIPVGLAAAVLSGLYVTPLISHAFGVDIGPVSLLNTFAALILPGMANGFSIFLLKGFFDSLPEEIFEAGKIDGASELRMFWQVAFPLSKPIFAVMALSTFTGVYGSYMWALVVCQSDTMWTLMVYLFQLQQFSPAYVTMAATVLASLPTLLVFIFAQNTIMRGIIIPAYK